MLTRYDDDGNLVAWVRPLDSDAMAELKSAHCYAAEFGTMLEWCAERTSQLFDSPTDRRHVLTYDDGPSEASASMARTAVAYTQIRDARRVERVLGGEAA